MRTDPPKKKKGIRVGRAAVDTAALKRRIAQDDSTYRDARSTHVQSARPTGNADKVARQAFARGTARRDTLAAARRGEQPARAGGIRSRPMTTPMPRHDLEHDGGRKTAARATVRDAAELAKKRKPWDPAAVARIMRAAKKKGNS